MKWCSLSIIHIVYVEECRGASLSSCSIILKEGNHGTLVHLILDKEITQDKQLIEELLPITMAPLHKLGSRRFRI